MKKLMKALVLLAALTTLAAQAQQAMDFDDYSIHYNALSSSLITPEVAKAYGIRRSDSRALINISVFEEGRRCHRGTGHCNRTQPDRADPQG